MQGCTHCCGARQAGPAFRFGVRHNRASDALCRLKQNFDGLQASTYFPVGAIPASPRTPTHLEGHPVRPRHKSVVVPLRARMPHAQVHHAAAQTSVRPAALRQHGACPLVAAAEGGRCRWARETARLLVLGCACDLQSRSRCNRQCSSSPLISHTLPSSVCFSPSKRPSPPNLWWCPDSATSTPCLPNRCSSAICSCGVWAGLEVRPM